jgi:hypothetical protein
LCFETKARGIVYVHSVDPRTFVRPRALPTPEAPGPGDRARELPLALDPDHAVIVAFLRHASCPLAERTMQMLREGAARAPEIQWIAISHAPEQTTARWCRAVGGAGHVQVLSDPSRRWYAEWGLGLTSVGHFLGRESLGAAASLARRGIRNRHPSGTRWQSAGTFALDRDRIVRWRAIPAHARDLPDLDQAAASAR